MEGILKDASYEDIENLFDKLDKFLHDETYIQLQDRAFSLEVDMENCNEIIEMYRDDADERSNR